MRLTSDKKEKRLYIITNLDKNESRKSIKNKIPK